MVTSTVAERAVDGTAETRTHVIVEIGETNLWVSVVRDRQVCRPVLVKGAEPGRFPADLRVTDTGRWFWGVAHRVRDTDLLVSHILSRVDDPVPMVIGGEIVVGAELMARQLATLCALVTADTAARLTVVHPVDLSGRGRAMVERHLRRRLKKGSEIAWVSRAVAAVTSSAECADLVAGDRVGILHVGGSTVEAAVWTQTGSDTGEVAPVRVDRGNAGRAVDDALLAALQAGRRSGAADGSLRRECERAKVALSAETSVDVQVCGEPVRMVRDDIEQASARLLARQLDALDTALTLSERDGSPLRMILLVGGAAGAPSLVEAASVRFDVPVLAVPRVGEAVAEQATLSRLRDSDTVPAVAETTAHQPAAAARGAVAASAAAEDTAAGALARARRRWSPVVSLTATTATSVATAPTAPTAPTARTAPTAPTARTALTARTAGTTRAAADGRHAPDPETRPVSSTGPAATTPAPVSTARVAPGRPAVPPPTLGTPALRVLPASFRHVAGRPTRIALPQPTHLALAAAFLIAVAAVPAIGGALQSTDNPAGVAAGANRPGSGANAGIGGGLLAGLGLSFTPGASAAEGPADNSWLADPTGTLGPNQLLSMNHAAGSASTASASSTAGGVPAIVAAGTVPVVGGTPAATSPAGGSSVAGGSATSGGSSPAGGSTPASTNPPASNPPASNPPASNPPASAPASDPPASNPPASDPAPSNPPSSNPPPSDPPADPPPGDPAPVDDVTPASTPESQPVSSESSAPDGGASTVLADGADGTATP